jgi:hypothetical protein
VTVTVNPLPTVTATPSSQTICSGSISSIALSSNIVGTTYAWTVVQTGASGASNGTGNNIAQTLTATGSVSGSVVYTITPTAPTGCTGTPINVTITVNPRPVVTATPSSQTICSGTATSIALTADVAGTTFAWTVTQTGASGATSGNGNTIAQTLTATAVTAGTVTYTITPTANSCAGTPITVTITVNPRPVATATPSSQTICDGATTNIALNANVTGTTFTWSAAQLSGATISGFSNGTGNSISQTLTNNSTTAGVVRYTITPSANSCTGNNITVDVTVNPTPVVTATPSSQSICSGTAPSIALSSNVTGTSFSWTVVQSNVSGATNGSGNSIAQTLPATASTP